MRLGLKFFVKKSVDDPLILFYFISLTKGQAIHVWIIRWKIFLRVSHFISIFMSCLKHVYYVRRSLFVCKPQTKLKSILGTVPRRRMFIVVRILIRHFSSHGHFVDWFSDEKWTTLKFMSCVHYLFSRIVREAIFHSFESNIARVLTFVLETKINGVITITFYTWF